MSPSGEVVASISSALAVVLVLLACVELGDAPAAVSVYRLIQYDLTGAPLGSRSVALNHHAAALPLPVGADLSRSALVAPLLDLSLSFLREYLAEKKHVGGLLILLPTKLSDKDGAGNSDDKGQVKSVLAELEKLLVHEEVPSSPVGSGSVERWRAVATQAFQHYLDQAAPLTAGPWASTLVAAAVYALLVYYVQGFYVLLRGHLWDGHLPAQPPHRIPLPHGRPGARR